MHGKKKRVSRIQSIYTTIEQTTEIEIKIEIEIEIKKGSGSLLTITTNDFLAYGEPISLMAVLVLAILVYWV